MIDQRKPTLGWWTFSILLIVSLPFLRLVAEPISSADLEPGLPEAVDWNPGPEAARHLTFVSTDKPLYRPHEPVYVRGILLHHHTRTLYPNTVHGVLEITGPKGDVISQQAVSVSDGVWGTQWNVPADLAGGEYTAKVSYPRHGLPPAERTFDVRAYRAPRLTSQIKFLRDGYGPGDEVAATLEVERAEGGIPRGAKVTATVRVDGKQVHETQTRVGDDGRSLVRFPLPAAIQRGEGTLALSIDDGGVVETASKTIPILLQSVDLAVYPEAGQLVAGLSSRVYFEAFTPTGKPADVAGDVVDDRNRVVSHFRSEHEGRGRFRLKPRSGRSYRLRITEPAGITREIELPAAETEGLVFTPGRDIYAPGEALSFAIGATHDQVASLVLRQRDRVIASEQVSLRAGRVTRVALTVGEPAHGDGVLTATLYDGQRRPRAERLVFRRSARQLRIEITPESRASYVPGDTVRLKVATRTEQGEPTPALVGLRVTDATVLEMVDRREQAPGLPVMVFLENEVRDLADAHVYFDPENADAPLALDLLLGVQGWRRWALLDPRNWLAAHGDAGRRLLAQVTPPPVSFGAGIGGGNLDGAEGAALRRFDFDAPKVAAEFEAPAAAAGQALAPAQIADRFQIERQEADMRVARVHRLPARDALLGKLADDEARRGNAAAPFGFGGGFGDNFGLAPGSQLISVRTYAHQVRPGRRPGQRADFTETLYWNVALRTNDQGVGEIEFGLNDAVTSFQVSVDAVDARGSLGAAETSISSVQPFYLEPKLPLEVTAGDVIRVPLGIVNATQSALPAVAVDVSTTGLDFHQTLPPFELAADSRVRKPVELQVGNISGPARFEVRAVAGAYGDNVTRHLHVAPLGYPAEAGGGGMLSPNGQVTMEIQIPQQLVPGSLTAEALVFPTPLATLTASLERLIREPNGCFEQTSSTTYPLVMAQQYFMSHQGVDPRLIERSAATLERSYNRLLGFESPGGGLEWFGGDPGHDALTAYGLLEFTDMADVHPVDSAMVARTRRWLLEQRDGQGGYQRKTRTLHTWLAEPEVAFTYNTWALLEAGNDADLSHEVAWVRDVAETTDNSYVIALAANVLAIAGDTDGANRLLDKLAGIQTTDGSVEGATVSVVGSGGEALTIETTALAMTAWLRNPAFVENVERGIRYLAEVCKGGRFGSTQSTVLALRAIVAYDQSRARPLAPGQLTLWVDGQPVGSPRELDPHSHGSIRLPDFTKQLTPGRHRVELKMSGGSDMPCLLNVNYHTLKPPSSPDCQLHLDVKLAETRVREGRTTDAEVTVVNRTGDAVPTPTAIVGIPGGLEVRHDQLKEAVNAGLIAAYEVRGRELILYWRVLDAEQRVRVPLSLVAAVPGRYQGPPSRAYLYYTDEHKQWVEGLQVTIQPAE